MVSEPSSDKRCGIGARLRAGRERAGMTMLQAAEKLHVDSRMLEALEAENFESFGAPVFVRGHLRNYADLIGESVTELHQMFDTSMSASAPDLRRAPRVPRISNRKRVLKPAVIALVIILLILAVWWVLTRSGH